jgi:hypothetical protein
MRQLSMFRWFLVAGLVCLAGANQASADVIVTYPFTSNTNPSVLGAGVQSSSFDGSHLFTFFVANDGFGNVLQAYPSIGSTRSCLVNPVTGGGR